MSIIEECSGADPGFRDGGGGGGGGGMGGWLYFAIKNCKLDHENDSLVFQARQHQLFFFVCTEFNYFSGSNIVSLSQTLNWLH